MSAAGRLGFIGLGVMGEPERIKGYLACMGSEITHCGPVGAGQLVKLMNNMVVADTVGRWPRRWRWRAPPGWSIPGCSSRRS